MKAISRLLGRQVPMGPLRIDWTHSLAVNLEFCVVFNGYKNDDLVKNIPTAPIASKQVMTIDGPARTSTSTLFYPPSGGSLDDTPFLGAISVCIHGQLGYNSAIANIRKPSSSSNTPFSLSSTGISGNEMYFYLDRVGAAGLYRFGSYGGVGIGTVPVNTQSVWGLTHDGTAAAPYWWINSNKRTGGYISGGTPPWAGSNEPLQVGYGSNPDQIFNSVYAWSRVLTDSEMAYLQANPYCFLLPAELPMSRMPRLPAWQLRVSKNGGAYTAITPSSSPVRAADAGSSADNAAITIPRLTVP